jgi:hypothetical protein
VDVLVAGLPNDVHLAWRAGQALATEGLRFRLQAKGQDGGVFWEQGLDPLKPLPAVWPAGQTYRLTHRIEPQALPAGASDARLEVCALQDGVELACGLAGQPRVVEQPPVLELSKAPQHAVDAEWNEQLALAGYDVDTNEGRFALTLYWRVEQAPAESLKRFVHALDSGGRIVAQADDVPANGALPMPFWRAGEYVVDQVELQPPVDASATEFCVGWYEIASGARLPVRLANGEEPANEQLCVSLPVEASESGTVTPLSPPGGSQWVELTTIEVES